VKHIPHYRLEVSAGFEYTNRAASGNLPQLQTNSLNNSELFSETSIRLLDGQYQSLLQVRGFLARRFLFGDLHYSGGTAELHNRHTLDLDTRSYLDWRIKAGTARGTLPVEHYFVLGVEAYPENLLRGHATHKDGRYGSAPMGTDFVLVNVDFERRITTIPLFNMFNIPFITIKWQVFVDSAKTFDRNRVFQQGKLWVDTGAGMRFEIPSSSFNVGYGRSLRDGTGVFFGYVERRLW
jgi:hypothetical protein